MKLTLEQQLEELMVIYGRAANRTTDRDARGYFNGVADGLNKAFKLVTQSETFQQLKESAPPE